MSKRTDFLYSELASVLRTQIQTGMIRPGEYLLSENDFCEKYQLSRTSVRNSLKELLQEGLIEKIQGKGTRVAKNYVNTEDDGNTFLIASPFPASYTQLCLPILTRLFQEKAPDLKIKVLSVPGDMWPYLENLVEVGVHPDLIVVQDRDYQMLKNNDYFCELDEFAESLHDVPAPLTEAFRSNDKLFGIPLTYSPVFIAYHAEMFARHGVEAPKSRWTREQFTEAARAMTKDVDEDGLTDKYGLVLNSFITRWPALVLEEWTRFRANTDDICRQQALIDALSFLQGLIYRDKVCPVHAVNDEELSLELFLEGRIGMILTTLLGFPKALEYDIMPIPGENKCGNLLIANGMLLSKTSKNQLVAKQFLEMALDPTVQRKVMEETGLLSPFDTVNRQVLGDTQFEELGLSGSGVGNCKFIHQLVPGLPFVEVLVDEMKKYWTGMEQPDSLVERLKELLEDTGG